MKGTGILIVINALRTIAKRLLKRLVRFEVIGQVETIQAAVSKRSATILRRIMKT